MRVELTSETGTGSQIASVSVFDDAGRLHAYITADRELRKGADGGLYYRIILKREQIHPLTGKVV